jgi:hypothetical protein
MLGGLFFPQTQIMKGGISVKKGKKVLTIFCITFVLMTLFCVTAYAAPTGDVAGAIEDTWKDASGQIKQVVNNVVFPAIDLILAVFFFAKLGMAYFDYRKHGQFEWAAPAILFACLIFTLTAPLYIWKILGM